MTGPHLHRMVWPYRRRQIPKCTNVLGLGVGIFLYMTVATRADLEECQDAVTACNSVLSDASVAIRAYANCVTDSDGHEDCSSAFSALQSAQSDFENAVSAYSATVNDTQR
jgi:hypothetical protein